MRGEAFILYARRQSAQIYVEGKGKMEGNGGGGESQRKRNAELIHEIFDSN